MRHACLPALLSVGYLLAAPVARAQAPALGPSVDDEALYALPDFTWAQVDALLEYRAQEEGPVGPERLVEAGVLSAEQLHRLWPFRAGEEREEGAVSGRLRLLSAYALADAWVPPVLLQAWLEGPLGLRAGGVASLTRRRLGPVRYDARRRVLTAELPGVGLQVPKLYGVWVGAHASVLVGTYRLGFGQRLTLDTTGRPAPDGFVPDEGFVVPGEPTRRCVLSGVGACTAEGAQGQVTPDFGGTEGFRGVVGTVHGQVEGVALSFTGFGSHQSRDVSQYELFDRKACQGRRECRAPDVLAVPPGSQVPGASRFVSSTLPDVFHELATGGHVSVGLSPRAKLGVTGWGAWPVWAVEGVALDFQEHSRYPQGGGYGALGVDAAWGTGPVDLFVEGAWSGGFGAVQRTVLGDGKRELELTLRSYGRDFANPYARAVSSPDEFEGLRASNELGARLRYLHWPEEGTWRLAGQVDVWTRPPGSESSPVHLRASARVDATGVPELQPSLWVEHQNKDLGHNGPGLCFEGEEGCAGEQYRLGGRVRLVPTEGLSLAVQYQHTLSGSRRHVGGFQQDGTAALDVLVQPLPELRLHGRASWRDEDLSERTRLTQALRTSLEVAWAVLPGLSTRARYALALDLKAPEGARTPPEPPQHLFRLELESRF